VYVTNGLAALARARVDQIAVLVPQLVVDGDVCVGLDARGFHRGEE
jgi:hypothetical protein